MENQEFVRYRSPVEYLKIFFRRRWLFIIPVLVGLILSFVISFLLPKSYESSTVILVEEEKIINPLIQDLAVSTSVAQRMRTLKEQVLGWNNLVALTKKLNLAKDTNNQAEFEGLISGLRKDIVVVMRGPNLIKLAYIGKNPQETQLIVKTLTDIFIEENMKQQTKETDVAIDFIKEQLQVYKRKIKESEIASLEEQLQKLLVDSTEQHPLVKNLREKITATRKELGTTEYTVDPVEKPIASPLYDSMKEELNKIIEKEKASASASSLPGNDAYAFSGENKDDPNAAIYKLLLMDKLDSVLARDMHVNENIYNMLLQKLETAKITQRLEASQEGTRYSIIDPPRLPLKPVRPNKVMVVILGMCLGGFVGTGLVLGKEFMDQSFLDVEDAKNNLDLPILGAISRLTTQEEIDKEKHRKTNTIVVSVIVSVALIVVAMLIAFLKK